MSDAARFKTLLLWEEFSAGAGHPFAEPGILLAVCALACLIGQIWPAEAGRVLGTFALTALAGVATVRLGWIGEFRDAGLLGFALGCALVAAAAPQGAFRATTALAAAGGYLTGAASTPALLPLRVSLPAVAGAVVAAMLALALLAHVAAMLRRRFGGEGSWIGLRIAASWIAAIALILLALSFAPGR